MIVIEEALYINGFEKGRIKAEDITQSDYQEIYRGKLFCPIEGCNAELVHMDIQKRGNVKCFRTLQNSKHKDKCPNEVIKGGNKTRRIAIDGIGGVALSLGHVKNVLKDTYNLATGRKKSNTSKTGKKKSKSGTTNKDDEGKVTIKPTVSQGGVIGKSIQEKQPYIYKKNVSDFLISPKDIYCVYGEVVCVDIKEEEVFITIKDSKNLMDIYIGTPFKSNYPQQFMLLKAFKLYLDMIKDKSVVCTCICVSQEKNKKIMGEVMDFNNIYFDGLDLFSIINMVNNLLTS